MSTYHPTKYDSAAHEVVAILSDPMEGYGSPDYFGDADSPVGLVHIVTLDESHDLDFSDRTNYPDGDQAGEVARTYDVTGEDVAGVHVVQFNSQGFVRVITFADDAAREEWLDAARAEFDAWDES